MLFVLSISLSLPHPYLEWGCECFIIIDAWSVAKMDDDDVPKIYKSIIHIHIRQLMI